MSEKVFGFRNTRQRWSLPIGFAAMAAGAVSMGVSAVRGTVPAGFVAMFVAVLAWNGLWFLWLMGHTVDVVGDRVVWRAVLRRRELAVADFDGNGNLIPGFGWLTLRGGGRLWVLTDGRGWPQFLAALNEVHPDRPFTPAWGERFAQRQLAGRRSGFYER
ncbi:hypothetical protein [Kineosporia sp. R_H_3]|uniref:hypothetical protein n=1 Tax=Kineosporia sp. R_H_3 TaxID=1961848 RepID=UPI000B4BD182|nr:hypothetical protein [Kineosporia sp. R_H_3]